MYKSCTLNLFTVNLYQQNKTTMTQFKAHTQMIKDFKFEDILSCVSDYNTWRNEEVFSSDMLIEFNFIAVADFYSDNEVENLEIEVSIEQIFNESGEVIPFTKEEINKLQNQIKNKLTTI